MRAPVGEEAAGPLDLRVPLLAVAAWTGALLGLLTPWWLLGLLALAALAAAAAPLVRERRSGALALALVLAAVGCVAAVGQARLEASPLAALAAREASVSAEVVVVGDPRPVRGGFGDQVAVRARAEVIQGRVVVVDLDDPVLVLAGPEWATVRLGERVALRGRLVAPDERAADVAALLVVGTPPTRLADPDWWWRATAAVRGGIRAAVTDRPPAQAVLVPALTVGDDAGLPPEVEQDFRTAGLTHLTAVSGTNLTLFVGFLLLLARWCGVRGVGLHLVAVVGILGFVLVARTEPSVVRAAAMGAVGLLALGSNGRQRGLRGLAVAVVVLLLVDPGLALTPGFALSVLATGGIVALAPGWRDAMARWLPQPVAEAVAVPLAAQIACTPVVAALSGEVSLVAVAANLLAAPAVAPATVLGLAGGLLALAWLPLGRLVALPAAWSVEWLVQVARHAADLPGASVAWGSGPLALAGLTALCLLLVLALPRVLARPVAGGCCCLVLVAAVLVRPPSPGWPPAAWVLVMCDVGQGDALVLRAGPRAGVVVDAGPDPASVDACLEGLGVDEVPLLVLTHPHADHVGGAAGVLDGRTVGEVVVTPRVVTGPVDGHAVRAARQGETWTVGEVRLRVLWPPPGEAVIDPADGGEGSPVNDASVVLLAEVAGVSVLLTGDVEPSAQRGLRRVLGGEHVDVLKVPHHGSSRQDLRLLLSLAPRLALVSVGADNDYGHPAPALVDALEDAGAAVLRTDLDGAVAVVVDGGSDGGSDGGIDGGGLGVVTGREG